MTITPDLFYVSPAAPVVVGDHPPLLCFHWNSTSKDLEAWSYAANGFPIELRSTLNIPTGSSSVTLRGVKYVSGAGHVFITTGTAPNAILVAYDVTSNLWSTINFSPPGHAGASYSVVMMRDETPDDFVYVFGRMNAPQNGFLWKLSVDLTTTSTLLADEAMVTFGSGPAIWQLGSDVVGFGGASATYEITLAGVTTNPTSYVYSSAIAFSRVFPSTPLHADPVGIRTQFGIPYSLAVSSSLVATVEASGGPYPSIIRHAARNDANDALFAYPWSETGGVGATAVLNIFNVLPVPSPAPHAQAVGVKPTDYVDPIGGTPSKLPTLCIPMTFGI